MIHIMITLMLSVGEERGREWGAPEVTSLILSLPCIPPACDMAFHPAVEGIGSPLASHSLDRKSSPFVKGSET